jgi:hypothetical protein
VQTETIYIEIMDEGVKVWRPIKAERRQDELSESSADRPTKPRPGNSLRDRWCGAKRRHFPAERKALSPARGSARPFARRRPPTLVNL